MEYLVFMMVLLVKAGEEECLGGFDNNPVKCYECSANKHDHYCGNPFNESHPDVELKYCPGYCVKWYREPEKGKVLYTRSCSARMQISMRISSVCMEESRPSTGLICFCDKSKCNGTSTLQTSYLTCILFIFVTQILRRRLL